VDQTGYNYQKNNTISVDQIKNGMGEARGTHQGEEKCIQNFGGET
jgi:hypothetical protein